MDKGFRLRINLIFFLLLLFCGAVLFKSARLMLIPSNRLETTLKRQFREAPAPQPLRGMIVDRNNEPLAMSMRVRSLYANPRKIKKKEKLARILSKSLNIDRSKVFKNLNQDKGFVWIKRHLTIEEEKRIHEILDQDRRLNLVLGFAKESKRLYPNGRLAANILGFTGIDGRGLEGIEYQYDETLRSDDPDDLSNTIILTIDKGTQNIAEAELRKAIKEHEAKSGVAIIMDAESGDVWAMASYPTYDPNNFRNSKPDHRRNRPVTETFEPGSTVKALLIAGGLEDEILGSRSRFYCEEGRMQIGKHWIRESSEAHKWKWLSVADILKVSSNIGATKIGMHIGKKQVYHWYKMQGLTEKTEIDLPGEATGILRPYEKWSDINFSNITFGQGLSVTAMQMTQAFATLANNGFKVRPRVVSAVMDKEGRSSEPKSIHLERILKERTVRIMTKMLGTVTSDGGTGARGAVDGFRIAGKTGTAQVATPGKGYTDGKYITSFAGFAIDTKPKFVGYVAIREPKGKYLSGGSIAAPVFAKIMSATLARAGVAPMIVENYDNEIAANQEDGEAEKIRPKSAETSIASKLAEGKANPGSSQVSERLQEMPEIDGLTAREVLEIFSRQNIRLNIKGSGIVQKYFPKSGQELKPQQRISVYLGPEESVVQ